MEQQTKEHPAKTADQPKTEAVAPAPKPMPWSPPNVGGKVKEDMLCESCKFWTWEKDETQNDNTVLHFGRCRIRAPRANEAIYQRAVWPKTESQDGCGEHAAAPPPPAATDKAHGKDAANHKDAKETAHSGHR